jgi:hypothetical protein
MSEVIAALGWRERIDRFAQKSPWRADGAFFCLRGSDLSLAKESSIGLKSGLYGGRKRSVAPADSIR